MDYTKYYTFDEKTLKYITKAPLPLNGVIITLGLYMDEKSAIKACAKYFNKIGSNLGTKEAIIYAQQLEINSLKEELYKVKRSLAESSFKY